MTQVMKAYKAVWLVFHTDKVASTSFTCGLGYCGALLDDRLAVKERLTTSMRHMTELSSAAKDQLTDRQQRAALDARLRRAAVASAAAASAARWATSCASLMLSNACCALSSALPCHHEHQSSLKPTSELCCCRSRPQYAAPAPKRQKQRGQWG